MQPETFQNTAAQGDCFIKRVDEFPDGLSRSPVINGYYEAAHSETGHSHVLDPGVCEMYDQDEFISYLEVPESNVVVLKHLRSFDTHAPIQIGPGKYRIARQREYTPEGFRRAAD